MSQHIVFNLVFNEDSKMGSTIFVKVIKVIEVVVVIVVIVKKNFCEV